MDEATPSGKGRGTAQGRRKGAEARSARPLNRLAIEGKALAYLDRFDASVSRLRRVLERFVRTRAMALQVDPAPHLEVVAELLLRYQESGLVNDRRFASGLASSLAGRGASRMAIKTKLFGRGVAASVIDEAILGLGQDADSELQSARALVKKRHLGRHRPAEEQRDNYRRDLGVLARAGFPFAIARRALGLDGQEEEEP